MLPVLVGMAALQAGLGYKAAQDQAKESARRENVNSQLSALDTTYGTFVGSKSGGKLQETARGPGGLGGALAGGLSGIQTGMNINSSMKADALTDKQIAGLSGGGNNAYAGLAQQPTLGANTSFADSMSEMDKLKKQNNFAMGFGLDNGYKYVGNR